MDNLEKYIKDHKEEFDLFEPSPKLWSKIDKDLPHPNHRINIISLITRIAAVFILILVIGVGIGYYLGNQRPLGTLSDASKAKEFKMAEDFYAKEVSFRMKEINSLNLQDSDVKNDLTQLENIYQELKSQLDTVPEAKSEKIIGELIENYQIRISLLEKILEKTKSNENKYKHENNISI